MQAVDPAPNERVRELAQPVAAGERHVVAEQRDARDGELPELSPPCRPDVRAPFGGDLGVRTEKRPHARVVQVALLGDHVERPRVARRDPVRDPASDDPLAARALDRFAGADEVFGELGRGQFGMRRC